MVFRAYFVLNYHSYSRRANNLYSYKMKLDPILLDYSNLERLKQKFEQLIEQEFTCIDFSFGLNQKFNLISFNEIKSLIDEQTAILQWYITDDYIHVFIITINL